MLSQTGTLSATPSAHLLPAPQALRYSGSPSTVIDHYCCVYLINNCNIIRLVKANSQNIVDQLQKGRGEAKEVDTMSKHLSQKTIENAEKKKSKDSV